MDRSGVSGNPHVLVVDDHEDSREVLRQFLEPAGMVVTTVASADHALMIVRVQPVAIVLTDVSLDGGVRDGVWLLHTLQRVSPQLPVIAVTGRKERVTELLDRGFAAVLVKGPEGDDVVAAIRRALR